MELLSFLIPEIRDQSGPFDELPVDLIEGEFIVYQTSSWQDFSVEHIDDNVVEFLLALFLDGAAESDVNTPHEHLFNPFFMQFVPLVLLQLVLILLQHALRQTDGALNVVAFGKRQTVLDVFLENGHEFATVLQIQIFYILDYLYNTQVLEMGFNQLDYKQLIADCAVFKKYQPSTTDCSRSSRLQILSLKNDSNITLQFQSFPIGKTKRHGVVKHSIHIFSPNRVNRTIEHHPPFLSIFETHIVS